MPEDALFFYITAPDADIADAIAKALVEDRLAACVNMLPGMRSVYRWEGAIESGEEIVLIAKSAAARAEALKARVAALHPYETPCIVALPLHAASDAGFTRWIVTETRDAVAKPAD